MATEACHLQKHHYNHSLMNHRFLLLIFLLSFKFSYSQFSDSVHHYVSYVSAGVINKTNDGSSYVLNNTLKFNMRKKVVSVNFLSSWIYGQQRKTLTNNDFASTLDFSLFSRVRRFYYWGLASNDKSYSLKIRNRLQLGLGAAYNVIDKPNAWINLSNGLLYETSDLYQDATKRDIYQTLRNSFLLRFRWVVKEIVTVEGTNYLQNSLSDKQDYIFKLNNSISVKLRKWLSLSTAVSYNKSNRTRRENLLFTYGLNMEKFF